MEANQSHPRLLLTGATGYVGGRLLEELERDGRTVRCMARRPEAVRSRIGSSTEVVRGDVLDPASLEGALADVDTAYYLVHSMGSSGVFEEQDREGAINFARAARRSGVRRIVYLGGLGDSRQPLSAHLRSRHEVGRILRESGVRTIELRASIVIGSGSLSFEMVRALVERLPIMITPRWVANEAQPIAISDLLEYLVAAIDLRVEDSAIYEIGGKDRVSYDGIMREYARQRQLRRILIPVPVLTPYLSSLWLGLVTPIFARIGRKLVDSICHPTVVEDDSAEKAFAIRPMGLRTAIESALRDEDREFTGPRWCEAFAASGPVRDWGGVRFGNRLIDSREIRVHASPQRSFAPIRRIGGSTGWYFANWLWSLRGFIDLLVGGVGMRRGRLDADRVQVGDVIDCWRVEEYENDRRIRLAAEMRLPGRAWLEFEVLPRGSGAAIRQTAIFDPIGLAGLAYWYGIYPLHQAIFAGMLSHIARAAEKEAAASASEPHRVFRRLT